MKGIILCTLFVTMALFLEAQGNCQFNGKDLTVGEHIIDCVPYTCHDDGHISAVGCPAYACENQIGYREKDLSKPYPECCEGPICAEEA